MVRVAIAAACFVAGTAAHADPAPLVRDAITSTVSGAVIDIDTPIGTTVPVRYGEDGSLAGEANGLEFHLGSKKDRGRWWVAEDRLCHKWRRWFDGETQCMRLKIEGRRILWRRDDGKLGTATIVSKAPPVVVARAAAADGAPKPPAREEAARAPAPEVSAEPEIALAPKRVSSERPVEAAAPQKTAKAKTPKPSLTVPDPAYRVIGVDEDDVLNVRRGPSADHPIVGVIAPNGRGVRIVGVCVEDWCPITHRKTRGWVNRFYLVEEPQAQNSASRIRAWSKTSAAGGEQGSIPSN